MVYEKLAKELKAEDVIGIRPYPEFCFSVDAVFAEAQQDSQIEHIVAIALIKRKLL